MKKNITKDSNQTSGKKYNLFGRHARNAFFVLIYLVFTGIAIFGADQWENVYHYNWNDSNNYNFRTNIIDSLDNKYAEIDNDLSFPVPAIQNLGSNDSNGYPLQFFYESSEYSLYTLRMGENDYLDENSIKRFEMYINGLGKGCFGVYSINKIPNQDHPGIIWIEDQVGYEYRSSVILPDLNNDDINDIMVTRAQLIQLPKVGEGLGFQSYRELFFRAEYNESSNIYRYYPIASRFQNFFTINEDQSTHGLKFISPKIQRYRTDIYSGSSNTTSATYIISQNNLQFGSENILQAITISNQSGNTRLVLFTSNWDAPQYYSHSHLPNSDLSLSLFGYDLYYNESLASFNFEYQWQMNIINKNTYNYIYYPVNASEFLPTGMTSIILAPRVSTQPIKIQAFQDQFLITYLISGAYLNEGDPTSYTIFSYLYHIETNAMINYNGEMMWTQFGKLLTLNDYSRFSMELKDLFPLFQTQINGRNLQISRLNATTGERIASTYLDFGTDLDPIYNFDIEICEDLYYTSNLTIDWIDAEVFIAHLVNENNSYYNPDISGDQYQIACYRININPIKTYVLKSTQLIFNNIYTIQLTPTHVDFDDDGYDDYLLECYNSAQITICSGVGRNIYNRYYFEQNAFKSSGVYSTGFLYNMYHLELYVDSWVASLDYFLKMSDFQIFFADPGDDTNSRISAIQIQPEHLVYYEDINGYRGQENFMEFFRFGKYIAIGMVLLGIICLLIIFLNRTKVNVKPLNITPKLQKQLYISGIFMIFIFWFIFMVVLNDIRIDPKYTDIYISGKTSLYWIFLIYPTAFILFSIIPQLYIWAAPIFAEKFYFNLQKSYFDRLIKKGERSYQVLVMHVEDRRKVHESMYYIRSILPLLISLTVGMYIYTGLAEGGAIFGLLKRFFSDLTPLTHPGILAQWVVGETTIELFWLEIGNYARYMVLGILIGYLLTAIIIAPAWLLDDSGVVFYNHNNKFRELTDIDSVSGWILRVSTGALFITTITSWSNLFTPIFRNFNSLTEYLRLYYDNVGLLMIMIIFSLILYPIVASWAILIASNQKIEQSLVILARKLFTRMQKSGADVLSKDIRCLLTAREKSKPWTDEIELDGKYIISHENEHKYIFDATLPAPNSDLSQNIDSPHKSEEIPEKVDNLSGKFESLFESPYKKDNINEISNIPINPNVNTPDKFNENPITKDDTTPIFSDSKNTVESIFLTPSSIQPPWIQGDQSSSNPNYSDSSPIKNESVEVKWDSIDIVPPWKKKNEQDKNETNGGQQNE